MVLHPGFWTWPDFIYPEADARGSEFNVSPQTTRKSQLTCPRRETPLFNRLRNPPPPCLTPPDPLRTRSVFMTPSSADCVAPRPYVPPAGHGGRPGAGLRMRHVSAQSHWTPQPASRSPPNTIINLTTTTIVATVTQSRSCLDLPAELNAFCPTDPTEGRNTVRRTASVVGPAPRGRAGIRPGPLQG